MIPKIITTKKQYEEAIAEVESLIALDPKAGTAEADRLQLLTLLIETYEKDNFKICVAEPNRCYPFQDGRAGSVAERFSALHREQKQGIEVLSGKRPLTIQMIRALHEGLNIPAEVLLQSPKENKNSSEKPQVDLEKLPFRLMIDRGWIKPPKSGQKLGSDLIRVF